MAPPTPTSNGKADLAHVGIDDAINYFKQQTKHYPTEHRDAHMAMDDLMQKADKCALELVKFVTAQTVQKTIDFITSTSLHLLSIPSRKDGYPDNIEDANVKHEVRFMNLMENLAESFAMEDGLSISVLQREITSHLKAEDPLLSDEFTRLVKQWNSDHDEIKKSNKKEEEEHYQHQVNLQGFRLTLGKLNPFQSQTNLDPGQPARLPSESTAKYEVPWYSRPKGSENVKPPQIKTDLSTLYPERPRIDCASKYGEMPCYTRPKDFEPQSVKPQSVKPQGVKVGRSSRAVQRKGAAERIKTNGKVIPAVPGLSERLHGPDNIDTLQKQSICNESDNYGVDTPDGVLVGRPPKIPSGLLDWGGDEDDGEDFDEMEEIVARRRARAITKTPDQEAKGGEEQGILEPDDDWVLT